VLVQNLLILSSILGVTKIRAVIRRDPFRFALCGTAASLALSLLVPLVWNTEYLFNRVPQHMLGLVFLGCAIALADNGRRKVVVAGVAVAMFTIRTCAGLSPEWLPFATVLFLLWRRFVPLSRAMAAAVNVCAAASLFIYLTYGQVHSIANKTALAGQTWTHVALALLVGSAVWWLWERALDSPLRWLRWQTSAQTLPSDAAR
jgi:hypothetical protein